MARKPDISAYKNFDQIVTRMEEIVGQVRDKDTSLERSLDLFDEALSLGSKAVGLVDTTDFSPAELERMKDVEVGGQEADASQSSDTPVKEDQGAPSRPAGCRACRAGILLYHRRGGAGHHGR